MNILETILTAQNGGAVKQMGQQLGLDESQVGQVLSALVPTLAAGFQRNVQQPGGLDSLTTALNSGRHAEYFDNPSTLTAATDDGNAILGHILGSKDASREVASRAAAQTGVEPSILKKALPIVAALMMGTVARRGGGALQQGGGSGEGFASLLTPLLDVNKDGSVVDDVLGMMGKLRR